MAKIRNARPAASGGGYVRALGDACMADVMTRIQSTVISNGSELERIISAKARRIPDLDAFIDGCDAGAVPDGAYLCDKKALRKSKLRLHGHEPDFIAFTVGRRNFCRIVELKDGDAFDTKKSAAEKTMLEEFRNHLAARIPFRTNAYVCCFNQSDRKAITAGFKHVFTEDEVMTGAEFCSVLGISYGDVAEERQADADDNYAYVAERLAGSSRFRSAFCGLERTHISAEDFYGGDGEEEEEE